ncbi:MAG: cobyrinate a,c-diamide synthase [Desulfovibrio sp.]|nr:cobyrinate a,c-diamide synthase [Desulfovibrio sp.]
MLPGILVAGNASHSGKTTTTLALIAVLRKLGLRLATGKVGPDFLDTGYLQHLSAYPCANFDLWMLGEEGVIALAQRSRACDFLLVEGAMGLFDGGSASSANVAKILQLSVLLVLDVRGMAESVAAMALGFLQTGLAQGLHFCGFLTTHVGSLAHQRMLNRVLLPLSTHLQVPYLGGLCRDEAPVLAERHLGLVASFESPKLNEEQLCRWFEAQINIDYLRFILPKTSVVQRDEQSQWRYPSAVCCHHWVRVAIAYVVAFIFCYADLPACLEELGARICFFSPLHDEGVPSCDGVYLPGGYPELHASRLAANHSMLESLRHFVRAGQGIYGECGGYLYLLERLLDIENNEYPLLGLLPGTAELRGKRVALGYREVVGDAHFFGKTVRARGHEFHYALRRESVSSNALWQVKDREGHRLGAEGVFVGKVAGSFIHLPPLGALDFWRTWLTLLRQ